MAVYYKFKSAKDYDSVPIDGHFISVANLKEKIFESKHLGKGTDYDLTIFNAQTDEEYADEAMLIPKNTSVLVRRVPGRLRMPIVTGRDEPKASESKAEDLPPPKSRLSVADSANMRFPEESEWDEFGNDLYAIPEAMPVQSGNPVQDVHPTNRADEDSKLKALIDTPALDWQWQAQDAFGPGRGFGRGMGGRMMLGRGFGRGGGLERKTPPQGYICHRCKVPGHFIQHCPTNGDPNFDIKKVKPPTGIPKSMLMATPDGSYALPSGAVAVLKPNEAAFEKEIEGLPSARPVNDLPPELRCPLCKEVMKDAVLTSKCCFSSFCDKCIRDHIISKSVCVCGARNILADDLLPNKTLRETINRILESTTSSAENAGSLVQVQDMESARCPQPRVLSPTLCAPVKVEHTPPPSKDDTPTLQENVKEVKASASVPQHSLEKSRTTKNVGQSEATLESISVKEATSQGSAPHAEEEVQQKLPVGEQGKKKKKKKIRLPASTALDMQWKTNQDLAVENYAVHFAPSTYNPYLGGMQWGMDGFMMPPYAGAMPPYMGYTPGVFDAPFGGILPQDPFAVGGQGYMMPVVPQRDLSELAICSNPAPPVMSREEFEARKADLKRKREMERCSQRERPKEWECSRELSGADVSSVKSKPRPMSQAAGMQRHERAASLERSREPPARRSSDRDGVMAPPPDAAKADRKQKASVFSRISFPADSADASKKRKLSEPPNGHKDHESPVHRSSSTSNGYREDFKVVKGGSSGGRKSSSTVHDHDYSSDEDYHFKRKRPRHESAEWEEDARPSRSSRERERGRDHEREYECERPPKHR